MQAARGGRFLVRRLKVHQISLGITHATWTVAPCHTEPSGTPALSPWHSTTFRQLSAVSGLDHFNTNSQEKVDPFSLVADELQVVANRLRSMVTAEVPVLALAAEYFFKLGVEGKRFRPMVLLLMSTALMTSPPHGLQDLIYDDLRLRQQRIAEITEMIHVASLLHDDVLDHADTRRGISSLNHAMGNKLAVLAGDFLLARASVALASLRNTEVVELLSKVLEHLVTGEIMQLSSEDKDMSNMDYYMQKTFYKTASLMANSCKAIAVLAGQPQEVSRLAFDYGRHLGLAYQLVDDALDYTGTTKALGKPALSDLGQGIVTAPVLFALKEFPDMAKLIQRKFKSITDRNQAVEMVKESRGITQTHELAAEHAQKAVDAIVSLPPSDSLLVQQCRRALIDIAHQVITRSK